MSTTTPAEPLELAEAMRTLSSVSESLVSTYSALSLRAERVEQELSVANAELAHKVDELAATRAHLEAVLQSLPMGVIVHDAEGAIVRANAAACAVLDTTLDELVGQRSHPYLEGDEALGADREIVRDAGARLVLATRSSSIPSESGEHRGTVEILDDRTRVVELTERLHRLDKMAALGTMAGGIAHEIRNPMNAIQGFAELLKRELAPDSKAHRFASKISEGVFEADAIISNLLSFAQPERLRLETIDGRTLIDEAVESAFHVLKRGDDRSLWRVSVHVAAPSFVADRIKVRQALRNLIANAIQAQPNGGTIDIDLRLEHDEIELRVTDSGPGIPRHLRERVADPFFTTRADGTGLGLCLVNTVAKLHGGRLEVSSEEPPRGGADMLICIPFNPAS